MMMLFPHEKGWPDYALAVTEACGERDIVPLGASRLSEFPAEMRTYIDRVLIPRLSMMELDELKRSEGR